MIKHTCLWLAESCWWLEMAFSDDAFAWTLVRRSVDNIRDVIVALLWHLAILLFCGSTFSSSFSRRRFITPDISFNEEFDDEYAMVDMERSMRRGGENSARFDFSTRADISGANFGIFKSWFAGLRNNARFDVSRVAVVGVGIMSAMLLSAFLDEPGVFRPGVRRPIVLIVRRLGVAGLAFFINFLQQKKSIELILNDFLSSWLLHHLRSINDARFSAQIQCIWHFRLRFQSGRRKCRSSPGQMTQSIARRCSTANKLMKSQFSLRYQKWFFSVKFTFSGRVSSRCSPMHQMWMNCSSRSQCAVRPIS